MPSITVLTPNVKTASHPPNSKPHGSRKHAEWPIKVLPFAVTHIDAPILPDVQQAALGIFARIHLIVALREKGGEPWPLT
ncbi:MAG: hypothetical protein H0U76_07485 [Ktedonobacteraceae bacterium]|nr:hypothetical protein [Ktedonobacteraceae bacterium]